MDKHIGVEYIYEDLTPTNLDSIDTVAVLTPEAMGKLPTELLTQLQSAVTYSDLDLIATLVKQIATHDEILSQAIALSLHNFEYERILDLIAMT